MTRAFLFICLVFVPSIVQAVEFSEIAYDIAGTDTKREWVEIYNDSPEPIDLTGWLFYDGSYHRLMSDSVLTVPAGQYAVLASDAASFKIDYPSYTGLLIDTVMNLPNYSASRIEPIKLALADSVKQVIVEILYLPTKRGSLGYTLERQKDGNFADSSLVGGSPGTVAPPPPVYSSQIQLSELLANPAGPDTDTEWVELYNAGPSQVALDGWFLTDRLLDEAGVSKQVIKSGETIAAGGYITIKIEGTLLKNQNGRLNLYWPSGEMRETVNWEETIKDDMSYAKIDGQWQLTSALTPGYPNQSELIMTKQTPPTANVVGENSVSSRATDKPMAKSSPQVLPTPIPSPLDSSPNIAIRPSPLIQRAINSPTLPIHLGLSANQSIKASPLAITKVAGAEAQTSGRGAGRDRLMIAAVIIIGLVYVFHQAIFLRLQRWRERFWPRLIT